MERLKRLVWYNQTRRHSTLEYVSQMQLEQDWLAAQAKQINSWVGYGARMPRAANSTTRLTHRNSDSPPRPWRFARTKR